ncbi:MAG: glycine oxidase ThiO [Elusimicrobia bacterium]|nr:glycine oxidase ThiO [Elusimicrobiota bacterium]
MYSYEKHFDVVIVGSGVIGCSIAYYLAKESKGKLKVGVIDRTTIGEEASSGAAGMLAAQIEAESQGSFLELAIASRNCFPLLSQELKELSGVDIEYMKSGICSVAFNARQETELKNRMQEQKKIGLESVWLSKEEVLKKFPFLSPDLYGGFFVPEDGQVSSSRLTLAFSEAAKKLGVEFFEEENFEQIPLKEPRLNFIETNLSKFSAEKFVIAAGAWTGHLFNGLVPVNPIKGQILIFQMSPGWIQKNQWNTPIYLGEIENPQQIGCYAVPKKDGHLIVGATAVDRGFDKSEDKEATEFMSEYICKVFPEISHFPFKGFWAGLRPKSPDGKPVMGLVPGYKNIYAASGHFRNGILLSPITGKIFADIFLKNSKEPEAFSPQRFFQSKAIA